MSEVSKKDNLKIRDDDLMEKQVISFNLANEKFGIDILNIQEIIKMTEITKIPQSPEFVEGVINLRGKIITVVDLRKRFNVNTTESSRETRVIILELDDKIIGVIVDAVDKVLNINSNEISLPKDFSVSVSKEYIIGIANIEEELLILLDINKIFSNEELNKLANVA